MTTQPRYEVRQHLLTDGFTTAVHLATGNHKLVAEVRGEMYAAELVNRANAHTGLRTVLEVAFIAMGQAGANGDTQHPQRAAWEQARAALQDIGALP